MPLGHPIVLLNRLGSIHLSAHMSCSACVFVNSMASNCCELQLVPCTAPTSYPFNTLNPLSSFGCFRMSDIEVINPELSSQELTRKTPEDPIPPNRSWFLALRWPNFRTSPWLVHGSFTRNKSDKFYKHSQNKSGLREADQKMHQTHSRSFLCYKMHKEHARIILGWKGRR
jgi:hypothetical protein